MVGLHAPGDASVDAMRAVRDGRDRVDNTEARVPVLLDAAADKALREQMRAHPSAVDADLIRVGVGLAVAAEGIGAWIGIIERRADKGVAGHPIFGADRAA